VPFCPPLDWSSMLAFLLPRATPGVEVVESEVYRRTMSIHGQSGCFDVTCDRTVNALNVRVFAEAPDSASIVLDRVRHTFDLDADWQKIAVRLRADKLLMPLLAAGPGLRPPGCWDGFELAVRAILGQQVTVKGATTLAGRLVNSFGKPLEANSRPTTSAPHASAGLTHVFPTAEVLAEANVASIGLPRARAETIRGLARAAAEKQISFNGITSADHFCRQLCELPGFGQWTAQYIAMRALRDPDAFPASDLGLLRATGLKTAKQLEARSEKWRPWRAYAAIYLWKSLAG